MSGWDKFTWIVFDGITDIDIQDGYSGKGEQTPTTTTTRARSYLNN